MANPVTVTLTVPAVVNVGQPFRASVAIHNDTPPVLLMSVYLSLNVLIPTAQLVTRFPFSFGGSMPTAPATVQLDRWERRYIGRETMTIDGDCLINAPGDYRMGCEIDIHPNVSYRIAAEPAIKAI